MDQPPSSHWRQRFERGQRDGATESNSTVRPASSQHSALDDGFNPSERGAPLLSPEAISDEAAIALALDPQDYRPWVLQRGRSHPAMMLHLRRFEPRSGLWMGWQLSYPHLVAVEYTGDTMLSLDFGARQFVIRGAGLGDLLAHLQSGTVLTVIEYSSQIWPAPPASGVTISSIACVGQAQPS